MAFTIGNDTKQVYKDTSGSANIQYINDVDAPDDATTDYRRSITNLFGSNDAAGDIDISTGVYDGASTTVLESGSHTGTQLGGNDVCTNASVQLGGTDACTNVAPSATICTCATATFQADGVAAGDIVFNATTVKRAVVVTVDSETQLTTSAITGNYTGGNNIKVYEPDTVLTAVTAATATFTTDTVTVGDTVYNLTTGQKATVITVDSETELTTSATATAGWIAGDIVQVFDKTSTTLVDSAATFETLLVYPGCIVSNTTTGRLAFVVSVTSETALVTDAIAGGYTFGDVYEVIDPWTWTVIAGRTYAGAATINDAVEMPYAQGYRVALTGGGRLTITYKERS